MEICDDKVKLIIQIRIQLSFSKRNQEYWFNKENKLHYHGM